VDRTLTFHQQADTEVEDRSQALTPDKLWAAHGQVVSRFASMVARTDSEAEDIAQEAFVRAIRGLPHWSAKGGGVDAWLWRIVQNTARDFGRAARRRQVLIEKITLFFSKEEAAWPDIDNQIARWDLLAAIRSLPSHQRTLIAMRYGADLEYSAIGRNMGMSAIATRAATRRALSRLRRELQRTGAI